MINSKDISNITYPLIKVHLDNSIAKQLSRDIAKPLMRYIKESNINTSSPLEARELSREDIIREIHTEIALADGPDKLKYITELNKLEDNYKDSQHDPVINIKVIDYSNADVSKDPITATGSQIPAQPHTDTG